MKQSVYITALDVCITALDVGWRQTPQVFPFLSSVDAGLMPHGLSALANLVQAGSPLVPEGSAWLLLLALFLLLALAKNDSEWACYLQLLPCPLNAKGMCVYPSGPSTPHLLFFRCQLAAHVCKHHTANSVTRLQKSASYLVSDIACIGFGLYTIGHACCEGSLGCTPALHTQNPDYMWLLRLSHDLWMLC